jgi:hypothetical protein
MIDIASPTSGGRRPSPPVKMKGNRRPCGSLCGSYTGVERNTNQRELKVPSWKVSRKFAASVQITLGVKMRRKASLCVYLRRGCFDLWEASHTDDCRECAVPATPGSSRSRSTPWFARSVYDAPERPLESHLRSFCPSSSPLSRLFTLRSNV